MNWIRVNSGALVPLGTARLEVGASRVCPATNVQRFPVLVGGEVFVWAFSEEQAGIVMETIPYAVSAEPVVLRRSVLRVAVRRCHGFEAEGLALSRLSAPPDGAIDAAHAFGRVREVDRWAAWLLSLLPYDLGDPSAEAVRAVVRDTGLWSRLESSGGVLQFVDRLWGTAG